MAMHCKCLQPIGVYPLPCAPGCNGFAKKKKKKERKKRKETNERKHFLIPGMYERVNDQKKKKPGLKTLLAVGGWNMGSTSFSRMAATRDSRQKFALHAVDYLRSRNFDGLDFDWEYPGSLGSRPEDKQRFTALLQVRSDDFSRVQDNLTAQQQDAQISTVVHSFNEPCRK